MLLTKTLNAKKIGLLWLMLHTAWITCWAQNPTVTIQAHLDTNTVLLGEPFALTVVARYPAHTEVVFADTSHSYQPFTLLDRTYHPTTTQNGISTDSVVYQLAAFELGQAQAIQLPVYEITAQADSLEHQTDTLFVSVGEVITQPVDTLTTKAADDFVPITLKWPWVLKTAIAIATAVILAILALVFFKPIKKQLLLHRLMTRHKAFLEKFDQLCKQIEQGNNPGQTQQQAEQLIGLWKKHLTSLTQKPFDTYTTRQLVAALNDNRPQEALKTFDACIYGGLTNANLPSHAQVLKTIAEENLNQKRNNIKNKQKLA